MDRPVNIRLSGGEAVALRRLVDAHPGLSIGLGGRVACHVGLHVLDRDSGWVARGLDALSSLDAESDATEPTHFRLTGAEAARLRRLVHDHPVLNTHLAGRVATHLGVQAIRQTPGWLNEGLRELRGLRRTET